MRNLSLAQPARQILPRSSIKIARNGDHFQVRLRHPDDDAFRDLVDSLKDAIDVEHREFDREARCWVIALDAEALLSAFALSQMKAGAVVTWPAGEQGAA